MAARLYAAHVAATEHLDDNHAANKAFGTSSSNRRKDPKQQPTQLHDRRHRQHHGKNKREEENGDTAAAPPPSQPLRQQHHHLQQLQHHTYTAAQHSLADTAAAAAATRNRTPHEQRRAPVPQQQQQQRQQHGKTAVTAATAHPPAANNDSKTKTSINDSGSDIAAEEETHDAADAPIVRECIFENQRKALLKWVSPFLPGDPHPWSDETGSLRDRDRYPLPSAWWRWSDMWTVPVGPHTDQSGWVYSKTYLLDSAFHAQPDALDVIRRRKWVRTRVYVGIHTPACTCRFCIELRAVGGLTRGATFDPAAATTLVTGQLHAAANHGPGLFGNSIALVTTIPTKVVSGVAGAVAGTVTGTVGTMGAVVSGTVSGSLGAASSLVSLSVSGLSNLVHATGIRRSTSNGNLDNIVAATQQPQQLLHHHDEGMWGRSPLSNSPRRGHEAAVSESWGSAVEHRQSASARVKKLLEVSCEELVNLVSCGNNQAEEECGMHGEEAQQHQRLQRERGSSSRMGGRKDNNRSSHKEQLVGSDSDHVINVFATAIPILETVRCCFAYFTQYKHSRHGPYSPTVIKSYEDAVAGLHLQLVDLAVREILRDCDTKLVRTAASRERLQYACTVMDILRPEFSDGVERTNVLDSLANTLLDSYDLFFGSLAGRLTMLLLSHSAAGDSVDDAVDVDYKRKAAHHGDATNNMMLNLSDNMSTMNNRQTTRKGGRRKGEGNKAVSVRKAAAPASSMWHRFSLGSGTGETLPSTLVTTTSGGTKLRNSRRHGDDAWRSSENETETISVTGSISSMFRSWTASKNQMVTAEVDGSGTVIKHSGVASPIVMAASAFRPRASPSTGSGCTSGRGEGSSDGPAGKGSSLMASSAAQQYELDILEHFLNEDENSGDNGSLQNVHRRFEWLEKMMNEHMLSFRHRHDLAYPASWNVPGWIVKQFCALTVQHLTVLLRCLSMCLPAAVPAEDIRRKDSVLVPTVSNGIVSSAALQKHMQVQYLGGMSVVADDISNPTAGDNAGDDRSGAPRWMAGITSLFSKRKQPETDVGGVGNNGSASRTSVLEASPLGRVGSTTDTVCDADATSRLCMMFMGCLKKCIEFEKHVHRNFSEPWTPISSAGQEKARIEAGLPRGHQISLVRSSVRAPKIQFRGLISQHFAKYMIQAYVPMEQAALWSVLRSAEDEVCESIERTQAGEDRMVYEDFAATGHHSRQEGASGDNADPSNKKDNSVPLDMRLSCGDKLLSVSKQAIQRCRILLPADHGEHRYLTVCALFKVIDTALQQYAVLLASALDRLASQTASGRHSNDGNVSALRLACIIANTSESCYGAIRGMQDLMHGLPSQAPYVEIHAVGDRVSRRKKAERVMRDSGGRVSGSAAGDPGGHGLTAGSKGRLLTVATEASSSDTAGTDSEGDIVNPFEVLGPSPSHKNGSLTKVQRPWSVGDSPQKRARDSPPKSARQGGESRRRPRRVSRPSRMPKERRSRHHKKRHCDHRSDRGGRTSASEGEESGGDGGGAILQRSMAHRNRSGFVEEARKRADAKGKALVSDVVDFSATYERFALVINGAVNLASRLVILEEHEGTGFSALLARLHMQRWDRETLSSAVGAPSAFVTAMRGHLTKSAARVSRWLNALQTDSVSQASRFFSRHLSSSIIAMVGQTMFGPEVGARVVTPLGAQQLVIDFQALEEILLSLVRLSDEEDVDCLGYDDVDGGGGDDATREGQQRRSRQRRSHGRSGGMTKLPTRLVRAFEEHVRSEVNKWRQLAECLSAARDGVPQLVEHFRAAIPGGSASDLRRLLELTGRLREEEIRRCVSDYCSKVKRRKQRDPIIKGL